LLGHLRVWLQRCASQTFIYTTRNKGLIPGLGLDNKHTLSVIISKQPTTQLISVQTMSTMFPPFVVHNLNPTVTMLTSLQVKLEVTLGLDNSLSFSLNNT